VWSASTIEKLSDVKLFRHEYLRLSLLADMTTENGTMEITELDFSQEMMSVKQS